LETAHTVPDPPQIALVWARQRQAAEKIVYTKTLAQPKGTRHLPGASASRGLRKTAQ
jgi:hypothetical protein